MVNDKKSGVYIVLEGLDGCGKSGIATEVVRQLNSIKAFDNNNVIIHHRREPSYTNNGLKFRTILATKKDLTDSDEVELAELMMLDRMENTTIVSNILRNNGVVIQERNFLTALAYNEAKHTKEVQFIQELNKLSLKPDLLILLDVKKEILIERLGNREDFDAYEKPELLDNRKKGYAGNIKYVDQVLPNNNLGEKERIIDFIVEYVVRNIFSNDAVDNKYYKPDYIPGT